eukprot:scaffold13216_cov127-Skeletonema_marinoi.AAC.1
MSSSSAPEWQAMSKLISEVYDSDLAAPFREPVDWKALGYFDSHEDIKNPMHLGLIWKKLNDPYMMPPTTFGYLREMMGTIAV